MGTTRFRDPRRVTYESKVNWYHYLCLPVLDLSQKSFDTSDIVLSTHRVKVLLLVGEVKEGGERVDSGEKMKFPNILSLLFSLPKIDPSSTHRERYFLREVVTFTSSRSIN